MVLMDYSGLRSATGGTDVIKEFHVGLVVVRPLFRHVVLVEDGFHRAHRLARTTVDALVGVDIECAITLVNTINRALVDARSIFHINTGQSNNIRHNGVFLSQVGEL